MRTGSKLEVSSTRLGMEKSMAERRKIKGLEEYWETGLESWRRMGNTMIRKKSVGHETEIHAAEMKFEDFSLANFFERFSLFVRVELTVIESDLLYELMNNLGRLKIYIYIYIFFL